MSKRPAQILTRACHSGLLLCVALALSGMAQGSDRADWIEVEVLTFIHEGGKSDAWPERRTLAELHERTAAPIDPLQRRWQSAGTARSELEDMLAAWPGLDSATRRLLFERLSAEMPTLVDVETGVPPSPWWPDPMIDRVNGSHPLQRPAQRLDQHADYRLISRLAWRQALAPAARSAQVRITGGAPLWMDWAAPPRRQRGTGWRIEPTLGLAPTVWQLEGRLRLVQRQFTHVELDLTWREPATAMTGPLRSEFLAPHGYLEHRLTESRTVQRERIEYIDSGWLGVLIRITPFRHPLEGVDLRPPERELSTQPGGQVN